MIEPGIFRSDPVLGSDADGNFYYNSLSWDGDDEYWCDIFIIEEGSVEWDEGRFAKGGDKQWMAIDQMEGMGQGNNYSNWTKNWSICYPGQFTRSTDDGETFESCITIPGNPFWGTLATGPDGALYVTGYSTGGGGGGGDPNMQYHQGPIASVPRMDFQEWSCSFQMSPHHMLSGNDRDNKCSSFLSS